MKAITIWISKSKTRPYHIQSGERIVLDVKKNKKFRKLYVTRQFYSWPEWQDIESVGFSIHKDAIRKLIRNLELLVDDLDDGKNFM